MPYVIAQMISETTPALWGEASAYRRENLYAIRPGALTPVNYDTHILNSHSLTHVEAETHVVEGGRSLDHYLQRPAHFFGPAVVVKLPGDRYHPHWEVSADELRANLGRVLAGREFPGKLLLTTAVTPKTSAGYHDPASVLTLSPEAARHLADLPNFTLFGTTWKSSDHRPGSPERPVHKTLLARGIILECLELAHVPEGIYFLSAFPLPIKGASESPACPVLFTCEELSF
jgi:kynurenine formamidase